MYEYYCRLLAWSFPDAFYCTFSIGKQAVFDMSLVHFHSETNSDFLVFSD